VRTPLVSFLSLASLLSAVASAQDVTIDFDDIDTTASQSVKWSGDHYAASDVLFSTNGGALGAFRVSWANTSPNIACGSTDPTFIFPDASVEAAFIDDADGTTQLVTQEVSFWVNDSDSGGGKWAAEIYDVAGIRLDRITGTAEDEFIHFERNVPEIHRVVFLPSPDLDGMDTLVFDAPVLPGVWSDRGFALAGTKGDPQLGGTGSLEAGTQLGVELRNVVPHSPAFVVVGMQFLGASLFGGTLVPTPDIVIAGLFVDALGELELTGTMPAGVPSGTDLFVQAWIFDPAGPRGFAASNGLQATAP